MQSHGRNGAQDTFERRTGRSRRSRLHSQQRRGSGGGTLSARGRKSGQTYPWGDAFRKDNVNSSNDYGGTTSVDEFPGGQSPYGVLDMCGNVQEWCEDWYYDDYYKTAPVDNPAGPTGGQYRVCRGGFMLKIEWVYGVHSVIIHHRQPCKTMLDFDVRGHLKLLSDC
ncbi:MAG: SUMF1/EgtB/PvdO family nonheme iron enzyme [Candidatus Latescibacteria bacterium]|nr:SUMF1/EgtB/PvdO family nonheme iron enzyme [Candidatus Latescibacterota bacterium]